MNSQTDEVSGVLILADQSTEWMVAGLTQFDRLVLALNESLGQMKAVGPLTVCLVWSGESHSRCRLSDDRRLPHVSLTDNLQEFSSRMLKTGGAVLVVDTHLLVNRGGFTPLLQDPRHREGAPVLLIPVADLSQAHERLTSRVRQWRAGPGSLPGPGVAWPWVYLEDEKSISSAEKQLLRGTAKTQDGLVARFLNRPLSRGLSRLLARTALLPNQWTLMLTSLSVAGAILVMRGSYLGFALGAVLFQLHSMLDGCDGEIARVKYLESDLGRKLDGLCDRFTTLLYAVSLGIGLARQTGMTETLRWIYPLEGILAALLIGVSETLLSRVTLDEHVQTPAQTDSLSSEFVKEERAHFNEGDQLKVWFLRNSGLLFLGKGVGTFFSELTKRDVFNFGFMLLALCGWPQWILHILAVCGCGIAIFAVKDMAAFRQSPGRLVNPPSERVP